MFFAHLIFAHVTPKPCSSSVNIVSRVFCGRPFGLLLSFGTQFMPLFAGLSSHLSQQMTIQSHPPCFHYVRQRFHSRSSHQLLITHVASAVGYIGATWRIWLNWCFLRPTWVHNPNGKPIGSAVSAQLIAESLYTLQWVTLFPKISPSHAGSGSPSNTIPWAHSSPQPKRHLD